jgi:magnesium-transporting ATPase (P-type)
VEHVAHFLILYYPSRFRSGARCPFPYPILPLPLQVSAGCKVPADARVIAAAATLACDQACLTGESDAVDKSVDAVVAADAALQEQVTSLFAGTVVVAGQATAIVTATGMSTQIGGIQRSMQVGEKRTP